MPVIGCKIEQRRLGQDARAAGQPRFQALTARGVFIRIGEEFQPAFLLVRRGEGKRAEDRQRFDHVFTCRSV